MFGSDYQYSILGCEALCLARHGCGDQNDVGSIVDGSVLLGLLDKSILPCLDVLNLKDDYADFLSLVSYDLPNIPDPSASFQAFDSIVSEGFLEIVSQFLL